MGAADLPSANELDERRWRLYVLSAVITGCLLVLVARLVHLQVFQHGYFADLAAEERWIRQVVPAQRGSIRDATGSVLAATVTYETLYADTAQVRDAAEAARKLSPLLGEPADDLEAKLRRKQTAPVRVRGGLTGETADQVRELRLLGLYLRPESQRAHPQGNLAAQLLGVVGVEGRGLSGLEAHLDEALAGKPGWVLAERDTGGDEIVFGDRQVSEPVDGADVTLTIDPYVQRVAERELASAVQKHRARGGTVVVLDPRTGALLAVAAYPAIRFDDPDLFEASRIPLYRIPAVNDVYEPGSVFKVVTMGGGLDSGLISPGTTYLDAGSFAYASGVVRNSVSRPAETITVTTGFQRSSNVGAAYVGTSLGAQRFYEYVAAFGFGQPTGVGLPGEAEGLVKRPNGPGWDDFDLAASSFGQGIAVTPLQMATAVAAIANGGTLLQPYVVAEVAGPEGRRTYYPLLKRQAIRADVARQLSEMLVAAVDFVDEGKPRLSRVPGYRVAGKTGTSEVAKGRGYDRDATIASFVGYAPESDPRFVVLVVVEEPRDSPWGETVAAPAFRAIAEKLLTHYRVPPDESRRAEIAR